MSYPSYPSTSNGVTSGHTGHHVVPPQAIQSAISTHQQEASRIGKYAPGDETLDLHIQHEAAGAFFSGKIGKAEFDAIMKRINNASHDFGRRYADYRIREQAGQTRPVDWYKEFYGYTEEEAEERFREECRLKDIRKANESRSQSCMLQQSRRGRGH